MLGGLTEGVKESIETRAARKESAQPNGAYKC